MASRMITEGKKNVNAVGKIIFWGSQYASTRVIRLLLFNSLCLPLIHVFICNTPLIYNLFICIQDIYWIYLDYTKDSSDITD